MDPHAAENAQVDEKLTEEDGKKEVRWSELLNAFTMKLFLLNKL